MMLFKFVILFCHSFFAILPAYYCSLFLWTVTNNLTAILSGKIFHSTKICSFRFLNFKIEKRHGKLTCNKDRFCFLPVFLISYTPKAMTDKKCMTMTQVLGNFSGCICCGLLCLLMYHVADTKFFQLYTFATILCIVSFLYRLFKSIFSNMRNPSAAMLKRKTAQILALWMGGTPPSQLEEWLSEEIDFSYDPSTEQYTYTLLQYFCALEKADRERIRQLIYKMEKALPEKKINFSTCIFGELIFYYSYLEKDPERVERYKKRLPFMIENDMDLNGRRVYAYYLYGKGADTSEILNVIEDGLSVAKDFTSPGNIPMEIDLLLHLKRDLL